MGANEGIVCTTAETAMCDECDKLDAKIQHYRRIVDGAMDRLTNERVAKLIEDMIAEKARLHPDPEK